MYAASSSSTTTQSPGATPVDPAGEKVYLANCAMCHGKQREGLLHAFPTLVGVKKQLSDDQITDRIHHGKGNMPAFPKIEGADLKALLSFLGSDPLPLTGVPATGAQSQIHSDGTPDPGAQLFQGNCAFCHGRDAGGGESGPDLTRSRLVRSDKNGEKINDVVKNGRRDGKMPAFNFSEADLALIDGFLHGQVKKAMSAKPGGRKGVDVEDLQTGNVAAGKAYFNGAGGCAKCHSPTGDLAGIATRYEGLELEMRMLYPRDVVSKVMVTLPSGEKLAGTVAYQDEFVLGMRDAKGSYHSWPVGEIKFAVDSPVDAHAEQFPKYTDDDVHNLMAYIQTLK
ncbi:putative cytochrome c, associated with quino(hemo)protein alcohol dehydrogenase [Granulicella sibirica]|uniref:Putative cytochrome c, associated with quino(Hemo)protein alcohol dehydrogenase n=1 Tax=Granulicella sibirica TaxID=2479048 RepID=A0A4Q0SVX5_9BACT|nr:putative cytochrome c, associated with quino(hemo)protein alcohol dehydrogenase [Granulicella sibirica]